MTKKEAPKKGKLGRPRKPVQATKPSVKKRKNYGEEIIRLYLKDPSVTNVSIARKVGCDESLVRHYLKGKYRDKVDAAVREHYGREIFSLQTKAFKRLNELLDDNETPPHTLAAVCKFLLERWLESPREDSAEVLEFETIITESGTLQRIEISRSEKKALPEQKSGSETIDI